MNRWRHFAAALALTMPVTQTISAQEVPPGPTVARLAPISVEVEATGVLESGRNAELKAATRVWTELKIKRVVEQGTAVEAGQPVLWFETDDYERKRRASEYALELARVAFAQAELEMEYLKQTQALERAQTDRNLRVAREDLRYFEEVDREQQVKSAEFSLKMSEGSLENAQEELEQLQKMYKADELTEESEEIILKRARRAVESAQHSLDATRLRTRKSIETAIPREHELLKSEARKQELEQQKSQLALSMVARKKTIEFEKARFELEKLTREHEELIADSQLLVLKAPVTGVVYHGRYRDGKWSGLGASGSRNLEPEQSVPVNSVVMTIVDPAALRLRIELEEKQIGQVKRGRLVKITPTAYPHQQLNGQVAELSLIPTGTSKFIALASVQRPAAETVLMPGMTATARIVVYSNPQAIVIPFAAVTRQGADDVVSVQTSDGEFQERKVRLGARDGDLVEVLEGLQEGDLIAVRSGDDS